MSQSTTHTAATPTTDQTVEVLYQKMGDRWFAFSLVGDEVFVGSITPEEISALELSGQGAGADAPSA